jgi:hypothetical protein
LFKFVENQRLLKLSLVLKHQLKVPTSKTNSRESCNIVHKGESKIVVLQLLNGFPNNNILTLFRNIDSMLGR